MFSGMPYLIICSILIIMQVKNLLTVDPEDRVSLKKMIIRKIPR